MSAQCSKHPWREKIPGIDRCTLCFERPKAITIDAGHTVQDWVEGCQCGVEQLDLKRLCDEMEELASWTFGKGVEAGVEYARR